MILGGGRMSFVPEGTYDPEFNKNYTDVRSKWPRKDKKDLIEVRTVFMNRKTLCLCISVHVLGADHLIPGGGGGVWFFVKKS